METKELNQKGNNRQSTTIYQTVWRWHFYAGLFVIPIVILMSVTGIIYLFKPQLDSLIYSELLHVDRQTTERPVSEQESSVRSKYPNAVIKAFVPGTDPDKSSRFNVTTQSGRDLFVFVNPYTADVLGDYDAYHNLQAYAMLVHSGLVIGTPGNLLVELAACWTLVLVVTGLILWFPRKGSKIWGIFLPRLRTNNSRHFWRDLHSVPGFYAAIMIVFMVMSGLPWTGFWGEKFASVWSTFPKEKNASLYTSDISAVNLNTHNEKLISWAVEHTAVPNSKPLGHNDSHSEHTNDTKDDQVKYPLNNIGIDHVYTIAKEKNIAPGYTIILPKSNTGVFTISMPINDKPFDQVTMHIDQYSGRILTDIRWDDLSTIPKAVVLGISMHLGLFGGWINQLVMLVTALTIILLCTTGSVMWWKRRPKGRLGVPPMPEDQPLWKTAVIIISIMGVIFPLLGISLILIFLIDHLVIQKIAPIRRWLK